MIEDFRPPRGEAQAPAIVLTEQIFVEID